VVEIANRRGLAPVIFACEQTSHKLPQQTDGLRRAAAGRHAHAFRNGPRASAQRRAAIAAALSRTPKAAPGNQVAVP